MLSRHVITTARSRSSTSALSKVRSAVNTRRRAAYFHSSKLLQDELVKVPQMAESISEGTLKTWHKQPGDHVEADEEIATIETDKIDVSVNAPSAGIITEHLAAEEDTVSVGQDLFRFEFGEGSTATDAVEDQRESKPPQVTTQRAAPVHQQVEKDILPPVLPFKKEEPAKNVTGVQGSEIKQSAPATPTESEPASARAFHSRHETRVKMSRMRLRIAERLKGSQDTTASLTTFNEVDMSSLIEFRKKYKDEVLKNQDVKLGFMSPFVKACSLVMREIPAVNASIEGDEIVYRNYVDVSVAVATPKGLVTPVVRNAERMNFVEIEREIAALSKKARDGKLTLEDMAGGTFTISNGGVFGSLYGTPIINLPQTAVLGMHSIKEKAVVVDGEVAIRPIMVIALTYDHRLLDGREGTTFVVKVKEYLEDPRKMLLAA